MTGHFGHGHFGHVLTIGRKCSLPSLHLKVRAQDAVWAQLHGRTSRPFRACVILS